MLYVIKGNANVKNVLDENIPLYWNNEMGWVDRDNADVFIREEMEIVCLPIDGVWVPAEDEEEFA
jgi:hypothetical protein